MTAAWNRRSRIRPCPCTSSCPCSRCRRPYSRPCPYTSSGPCRRACPCRRSLPGGPGSSRWKTTWRRTIRSAPSPRCRSSGLPGQRPSSVTSSTLSLQHSPLRCLLVVESREPSAVTPHLLRAVDSTGLLDPREISPVIKSCGDVRHPHHTLMLGRLRVLVPSNALYESGGS